MKRHFVDLALTTLALSIRRGFYGPFGVGQNMIFHYRLYGREISPVLVA